MCPNPSKKAMFGGINAWESFQMILLPALTLQCMEAKVFQSSCKLYIKQPRFMHCFLLGTARSVIQLVLDLQL